MHLDSELTEFGLWVEASGTNLQQQLKRPTGGVFFGAGIVIKSHGGLKLRAEAINPG